MSVDVNFINWGHFDLSPYGGSNFTTELVLDESGSLALLAIAGMGVFLWATPTAKDSVDLGMASGGMAELVARSANRQKSGR